MTAFDKLFTLSTVNPFLRQWDCFVSWYQKINWVKLLKEKNGLVHPYLLLLITSWCRMDFWKMCKWQIMMHNIVFIMFPEEIFHGLKVLTGHIHSVGTTRGLHFQSQTLVTRASRNTKSLQFPTPHLTTQRLLKSMGKVWITRLFCFVLLFILCHW